MPKRLETCCPYRRKIVLAIAAILPEKVCGVSDAEIADLIDFRVKSPGEGFPVVAFRFCPWCGKPRQDGVETYITEPPKPKE